MSTMGLKPTPVGGSTSQNKRFNVPFIHNMSKPPFSIVLFNSVLIVKALVGTFKEKALIGQGPSQGTVKSPRRFVASSTGSTHNYKHSPHIVTLCRTRAWSRDIPW